MNKQYQLDLSIQDLKQASQIIHRAADRLDAMNHDKSYTLSNLIADFEELIDELENPGE
ncbi:hypothetical protein [Laceyella putida]|uniref:Uncharacterized protein n=1 Tax=Laceyella putida TaxID=110101 RepID=A0ABW2RNT5_9BACL